MRSVDPVQTFRSSLKRCLAAPDFLLDFYGFFMASSDEVRQKLEKTDLRFRPACSPTGRWRSAAQGTAGSPAWGDLPRLAKLHSRSQLDIRPDSPWASP